MTEWPSTHPEQGTVVVACDEGVGEQEGLIANAQGFYQGDGNVLKLDCGDGCIMLKMDLKKHWVIYFKWINCVVCELYLNKVALFKKSSIMGIICAYVPF